MPIYIPVLSRIVFLKPLGSIPIPYWKHFHSLKVNYIYTQINYTQNSFHSEPRNNRFLEEGWNSSQNTLMGK